MDPYLEDDRFWPSFQNQLAAAVCHALTPALTPALTNRYRAGVATRRYTADEDPERPEAPRERHEEFVEVRADDGRLVTSIQVVSPANKTTAAGREAYLGQRRDDRASGVSLVEIDLVLQGKPTLDYSREGLPAWDYAVTVVRSTQPERYEIYTSTLRKRLPRFKVPLAADDRDVVMDLPSTFARCYDEGNFAARIAYYRDPAVSLADGDRRWLADLLEGKGLRAGCRPTEQEIAEAAYHLWRGEGCPDGRDKEHWFRAVELISRRRGADPVMNRP
jgi:hypothetical protein